MDIKGSKILPRFNKLSADGDIGIAKETKDSWETFTQGLLLILGKRQTKQEKGFYHCKWVCNNIKHANSLQKFLIDRTELFLLCLN